MKAFVVDDAVTVRMMVGQSLNKMGFETVLAKDGQEALEQAAETSVVDLFVIDWNMPKLNGLELVKALRQHPQYQTTPVLMATAETDLERVVAALSAGVDEYIMKPFTEEMLKEKLEIIGFNVN